MKTHTIEVGPHDQDLATVCNEWEKKGWGVRQIVITPSYWSSYVVFEAEEGAIPVYSKPVTNRISATSERSYL
jgi:hypothetical protein